MKNCKFYFSLFIISMLLACNTDDDNNSEPEPIVANAKILQWGQCTPDHNWVELYDPDYSILPQLNDPSPIYDVFEVPEEYWLDDLEVYIEYEAIPQSDIQFCPSNSYVSDVPIKITHISLPTPQEN